MYGKNEDLDNKVVLFPRWVECKGNVLEVNIVDKRESCGG